MSVDLRRRPVRSESAPARTTRGSAPGRAERSRRSPLVMSAAAAVLLGIAASALHVLFQDGFWWVIVMLVVTTVLGAAALTRSLTSNPALPTLAGLLALGVSLNLFFLGASTFLGVIPTLDTPPAIGDLLSAANASIYRQSVPAVADPPILFVLALGFGVLAVIVDLLAIGAGRPALAALPLLGILAVPVSTDRDVADPVVFAVTAAGFLAFLLLGSTRPQPKLAAGIGAVAIVGSLLGPAVLPEVQPDLTENGASLNTGVNPVLDLGDDLRRGSDRTVIEYSSASGRGHYLRLVTLETFTGDEWAPSLRDIDEQNTVDAFTAAPGLSDAVATTPETLQVRIGALRSRWLPMIYPPSSVAGLPDEWYFEPEGFSVSRPGSTTRGLEYTIESVDIQPTPEQLLAAGTLVDPSVESYTVLPDDLPVVISDTAAAVTSSLSTNYERAVALQEFFRSGDFLYSEDAPVDGEYDGTGMDIIATFLDVKAGYCVHFASSMAVMARSLGIPARVVVGFLPGDAVNRNGAESFSVSTNDLHAWPELYFDGIGWVQFEPTPGRGEPADYADVTVEGVPTPIAPSSVPSASPSASVAPSATPSASVPADALDTPDETGTVEAPASVPVVVLVVMALLVLVLLPAMVRVAQRRRLSSRLDSGRATAVDAWTEVRMTAVDLGLPSSATVTPRQTVRGFGGGEALHRIVDAVEQHSYAGTTLLSTRSLARTVSTARAELTTGVSRRRRVVATLFPASLWRRVIRPFSDAG